MKNLYKLFFLVPYSLIAQSQDQNYIKEKKYKIESSVTLSDSDPEKVKVDVIYFDGLGRPIQRVEHKQSGSGKDLTTHIAYDVLGREDRQFLPFETGRQDILFDPNAETNTINYPIYNGNPNPYIKMFYDKSPLNRLLKQASPGLPWIGNETNDNDKTIKFVYDINSENDKVYDFYVDSGILATRGYCAIGKLYKTIIKNENWISGRKNTSEEYKDNLGRLVLKRMYETETSALDTYYVYDSSGNLSFVIPPLASESIATIQSSQIPYYYNKSIPISDLLVNYTGGGGSMTIRIENNTLKIIFSSGFNATRIDVTKSIAIEARQPVPNMTIGSLIAGFQRYTIYVENDQLKFIDNYPNSGDYTSLNQTLSVPVDPTVFGTQTVYNTVINQSIVTKLCYEYKYDSKFRLIEKKIPGKQWEYMVYDKLDRLVATGPTLSPFKDINFNGWHITKYDDFNRPILTGWTPINSDIDSTTRQNLQTSLTTYTSNLNETKSVSDNNINGILVRYTNQAFPTSNYHVLSVNYYDDYSFPNPPSSFDPIESQEVYFNLTRKPKGLPTGSWTRVLESTSTYNGESSYILYDYKANPISIKKNNYFGGYTIINSNFSFSGKTLYTITKHRRGSSGREVIVREDFAYTYQDRLLSHTHKINNNPTELLNKNEYNELGQLIRKSVGNSDVSGIGALQKIDYTYNIRGWLKGINDTEGLAMANDPLDLFAFKIYYEAPIAAPALFNGNIAETGWKTASDNKNRRYAYYYDALNRLTHSAYIKENTMTGSYNESINYDKNGNIDALWRNGALDSDSGAYIEIDALSYYYDPESPNRLIHVEDDTRNPQGFNQVNTTNNPSFTYDSYGNMITDRNKGITGITYNHLNLPTKIIFGSESNKIEYLYTSDGKKISKTVVSALPEENRTIDYLDGFQYDYGEMEFFPTAEGYVRVTPIKAGFTYSYNYVYNYTDHLGNVRVSYAKDTQNPNTPKILEENHYYPFGLKHTNYNSDILVHAEQRGAVELLDPVLIDGPLPYNYKYNGKEFQNELGLNFYDYGARNYDPSIGRWMNIDPLAEKYYGINPYAYVFNNPVQLIDPTGMTVEYADDPNKTKKENRQAKREFKRSQRELNRKSPEAKKNWNALKNSKNVHTIHLNEKNKDGNPIENTTKPKVGYEPGEGNGGGTDIYIDLNHTTIQGEELGTNIISIGHEEGHAFRIDQGLVEGDYVANDMNPDNGNLIKLHISKIMEKEEIEATHIENIIRAQLDPTGKKYPLRATYDNKELYKRNPFTNEVETYKKTLNTIKDGYNYYKKL